ncbi:MAG: hypothetical protein DHS20C14_10370 [Phycisphaeraceae bacterium]|nr:MAG: hypothetical protein DHS20C14_10370 [Phycisphaeraceae bacterium]
MTISGAWTISAKGRYHRPTYFRTIEWDESGTKMQLLLHASVGFQQRAWEPVESDGAWLRHGPNADWFNGSFTDAAPIGMPHDEQNWGWLGPAI